MRVYYCDSSVLVKRHILEPGSLWFRPLVDRLDISLFTVQISLVEVCSALNRRQREGAINRSEYHNLMAQCVFLFNAKYDVIRFTDEITDLACAVLERQPLRSLDALHLAAALFVNTRLIKLGEPALIFLATDHRLLTAATAEGLATFDPTTVP